MTRPPERTRRIFIKALSFFLCGALSLPSSAPCADSPSGSNPARFLGVKRWKGTINVEMTERHYYLKECGQEIPLHGDTVKDFGKSWDRTVTRGMMTLNLDFVSQDDADSQDGSGEEPSREESEEAAQMAQLEAMAERFAALTGESMEQADADDAGEQIRGWIVDTESGQGEGQGSIRWIQYQNWSCPNGKESSVRKGAGAAKQISGSLGVTVSKDWQDYSLTAGALDQVPASYNGISKWREYEDHCRGGRPDEVCQPHHWKREYYWRITTDTISPEGVHTQTMKTTSRNNPDSDSSSVQSVPQWLSGLVGNAAGMTVVDMSDPGRDPFGEAPGGEGFENVTDPESAQAYERQYKEEMKKYRAKAWPSLPQSGNTLQGATTWTEKKEEEDMKFERTTVVRWNLAPHGDSKHQLEVEIPGYKEWRPKGNRDPKKRGNTLTVKARLIDPETKKPSDAKAEKFVFELRDVSKMPGTAMNWPVENPDTDYDLRFEASEHPADRFTVGPEGLSVETKGGDWKEGASVKVSSFDWGGTGTLYVRAVLPDGTSAEGHLKGDPSRHFILLPKRAENSFIADVWKEKTRGASGKADEADDEAKPENRVKECASHKGDGLSLYEEYRGFYSYLDPAAKESGGHIEGDPERKDFFVSDTMGGLKAAIYHFQSITGLNVHAWLNVLEMRKDHAINFNKGPGNKNPVLQHAVDIKRSYVDAFISQATPENGRALPSTPAYNPTVIIGYGLSPEDLLGTVAHELLHCASVWHHGDRDKGYVWWEARKDADGNEFLVEKAAEDAQAGAPIEAVYESTGMPVHPLIYRTPIEMWVAKQHGQHSGDAGCVMRYDLADAFDPVYPRSNRRVVIDGHPPEPTGLGLCTTTQGTQVNAPPLKRHGHADLTAERGSCRWQICVNDKYAKSHKARDPKG